MTKQIITRLIAIFFLSFPLAFMGLAVEREEQQAIATFSHAELVAHLNTARIDSAYAAVALVFCVGLLYVVFVEGMAYVLRWAWKQFEESKGS